MNKDNRSSLRFIYRPITQDQESEHAILSMKTMDCSLNQSNIRLIDEKATPLQRFGILIRFRRRKVGYDPLTFASKIGIDFEFLAAIEFGFAPLEVVRLNLNRIASGLGLQPAALMGILNDIYSDYESFR